MTRSRVARFAFVLIVAAGGCDRSSSQQGAPSAQGDREAVADDPVAAGTPDAASNSSAPPATSGGPSEATAPGRGAVTTTVPGSPRSTTAQAGTAAASKSPAEREYRVEIERNTNAFGSSTDGEVTQIWKVRWGPTAQPTTTTWDKITGQHESADVVTRLIDGDVVGVLLPQQIGGPPPASWTPAPLVVPGAGAATKTHEGTSTGTYETYGHHMRGSLSWTVRDLGAIDDRRCADARKIEREWTADVEEEDGPSRGTVTSTSTELWCGTTVLLEASGSEQISTNLQTSSRSWVLRLTDAS